MLSARKKCTDYRHNILWKRNDPSCIQDEVLAYRQIRLPDKFYQNDVHKHQQQLTMETKKDYVDMDGIDGGKKQQLTKKELDDEAALMVKGFEILQSVTEQKERKTGNASVSLHPKISDKEFKSDDIIKPMQQNLTDKNLKENTDAKAESINKARQITSLENKLSAMYVQSLHQEQNLTDLKQKDKDAKSESINKARQITSLENKLSAMYLQSLHQFDQMSSHVSDLLGEHKVTVVKYRASKDEVKSLRRRIDLSDTRCGKLESLLCEAMDEHENTKGKFRKQLAMVRKRSWEIHDLNEEIAGKDTALADMEKDIKKEKKERVELEKINADAVKELDDCRKALACKRELCIGLEEQNGMLMKEKMGLAGSLADERQKSKESEEFNKMILKDQMVLAGSLADERQKSKELEECNKINLKDQMVLAKSLANVNGRLDAQQHKSDQLEVDVKRLLMEKKDLEKKLEQESSAKMELSLKLDKVTHAVLSQRSKNIDLAKELATAVSKSDDLQGSLNKVLSEIKNSRKACEREKLSRKSLSERTMAMVYEKDAELVKVRKKLEATKRFLATINDKAAIKQGFKARHCTGVGSEKDVTCGNVVNDGGNVVLSEEKKIERKRRGGGHKKKKGAATGENNNSSADSLETITSLSSLNKGKSILNFHFSFQCYF